MKKYSHQGFYYIINENTGLKDFDFTNSSLLIFIQEQEFNNSELNSFLHKILGALPLKSSSEFAIVSCQPEFCYPIRHTMNIKSLNIISFGIDPGQLELQGFDNLHHIYQINSHKLLFAHLLKFYTNENAKKQLWHTLKQLFEI